MRTSTTTVRRFTSGLVGLVVLSATAWMGFLQVEVAYYNYYLFPKLKEGYIAPTRWQDFVFISVFWVVATLLFYVPYRLLKYAFKHRPVRLVQPLLPDSATHNRNLCSPITPAFAFPGPPAGPVLSGKGKTGLLPTNTESGTISVPH